MGGGNASALTAAVKSNPPCWPFKPGSQDQALPYLEAAHSAAEAAEQHWQTATAIHQDNVLEHLGVLPKDTLKMPAHVTTEASQGEKSSKAFPPEISFA